VAPRRNVPTTSNQLTLATEPRKKITWGSRKDEDEVKDVRLSTTYDTAIVMTQVETKTETTKQVQRYLSPLVHPDPHAPKIPFDMHPAGYHVQHFPHQFVR